MDRAGTLAEEVAWIDNRFQFADSDDEDNAQINSKHIERDRGCSASSGFRFVTTEIPWEVNTKLVFRWCEWAFSYHSLSGQLCGNRGVAWTAPDL